MPGYVPFLVQLATDSHAFCRHRNAAPHGQNEMKWDSTTHRTAPRIAVQVAPPAAAHLTSNVVMTGH